MMSEGTRRAWIGLGGNVGDVAGAMRSALQILAQGGDIRVEAVARLYSTPPWGYRDQPDFLNSAATLVTSLGPRSLLARCLATELALKRERLERWGPRTIDLDILAMEDVEIREPKLQIPHPRLGERAFALLPLAELAPDLVLAGRTVSQLAECIDRSGITPVGDHGWHRQPE